MPFPLRSRLASLAAGLLLAGCVVYDTPPPAPQPSKYDRAWNAALAGAQDAGIAITQVDPAAGTIRGNKNGVPANVSVTRQAGGGVEVRFDSKDAALAERFSQAYDRRMGR
ncbi:hypothetical protein [Niveibacterium sp. SC-1]|uniref:hypothetical protein n=1 Tax=Niveibacterium sp. SC-1 TaxID=3135646 RepID=UPI00311D8B0A